MTKRVRNDHAVLWLVDENGRRAFPVSKEAWSELRGGRETERFSFAGVNAMAGMLTTMRAQSSPRQ